MYGGAGERASAAALAEQHRGAGPQEDSDEEIELLYDTLLGFYYDPKTNRRVRRVAICIVLRFPYAYD